MIEIREILCPTDFSVESRHALEHARVIAQWYGSRITALHVIHVPVIPEPPLLIAGFADRGPIPASVNDREREEDLRAWLEPVQRAGIKTEVLVDQGNAARKIVEHADARHADLVVMGTHGLGGFERFMLGSVAERVLRKAKCAVMTVPPAAQAAARVPYKRLLCPVDFSEPSLAALRFAFSLAEEADASMTILHVFDWPADDELFVERFDVPEFRRFVEDQGRRRLEALMTDDLRIWCKPSAKLAYGKPYREILDAAAKEDADLIVIGIRGRNPLDLTLFGSTANHVVRRASCPVLTLRQ
jgi:nucleotide-binding universal stress UspA family protein